MSKMTYNIHIRITAKNQILLEKDTYNNTDKEVVLILRHTKKKFERMNKRLLPDPKLEKKLIKYYKGSPNIL